MYCRNLSTYAGTYQTGPVMYSPHTCSQSLLVRPLKILMFVTAILSVLIPASAVAGTQQLSSNPDALRFGSVVVGKTSTIHVSVTNNGSTSVTISSMNVTGTGFSVANLSLPLALAAGQSADF